MGLVLAAVVILVVMSEGGHRLVRTVLENAQGLAAARPVAAMLLIVLFSALAAMLAFVSSWVVVPFAVFTWGPAVALALLWIGWLLGGAATYAVGRFVGRPAVRWLVRGDRLARYEQRFVQEMPFYVVLLVQLALPSEIPGYLLGTVRYSFARYLAALGLVEFAYAVLTVYLGDGLVERRLVPVFAGLALLAFGTLAAAYGLRGRLKAQTPEGNVSATSPRSHNPVRSSGSTARVVS